HLSRRHPQYGDAEGSRCCSAEVSSGLRPRRLLWLRPHATRRHAEGSSRPRRRGEGGGFELRATRAWLPLPARGEKEECAAQTVLYFTSFLPVTASRFL